MAIILFVSVDARGRFTYMLVLENNWRGRSVMPTFRITVH